VKEIKEKYSYDKMQHPYFHKIKIIGENFWPSKDSGGVSYIQCAVHRRVQ
jgi:hypothetical protein